jgi:fructokinase
MLLICGDALIDFIPTGGALATARGSALPSYLPLVGGSCCNVAMGLGRLSVPVGFMGGISTDFFGQFLANSLTQAGVSLRYAARLSQGSTLAFVKLSDNEPEYAFYDRETAMRSWVRTVSPPLGEEVTLIHIGSVALIGEPAAAEYLALFQAEKGRRLLSIDPNCRPSLIEDPAAYHHRLREMLALADIIKLSVADLDYLLPGVTPDSAARTWIEAGARLIVATQGVDGVAAYTQDGRLRVPAKRIVVADTVGAGDSLLAGLFWQLEEAGRLTQSGLDALSLPELEKALSVAVAAAAITCGRTGADLPWRAELSGIVSG